MEKEKIDRLTTNMILLLFICKQMILIGFFLLCAGVHSFPQYYGEWTLWHSTMPDLPDNRVVFHIFPENQLTMKYRFTKGPFIFHKTKIGTYKIMEKTTIGDEKHSVNVRFHKTEEFFLSAYGIGLQNLKIKTQRKENITQFKFIMSFEGNDDIYLRQKCNHDCFHIVRSVRINEPSVDIPISTFIITQIIGSILGHLINQILFHTN